MSQANVALISFTGGIAKSFEYDHLPTPAEINDYFNRSPSDPGGGTRYENPLDRATDWLDGRANLPGGPGSASVKHGAGIDSRIFFLSDGGNNDGRGGFNSNFRDVEDLYSNVGTAADDIRNLTIRAVAFGIPQANSSAYNAIDQVDDNVLKRLGCRRSDPGGRRRDH